MKKLSVTSILQIRLSIDQRMKYLLSWLEESTCERTKEYIKNEIDELKIAIKEFTGHDITMED